MVQSEEVVAEWTSSICHSCLANNPVLHVYVLNLDYMCNLSWNEHIYYVIVSMRLNLLLIMCIINLTSFCSLVSGLVLSRLSNEPTPVPPPP